jgi:hypothetical protein
MHKMLAALVVLTIAPVSLAIAQKLEAVPRSEVAPRLLNLPIRSVDDQPIGVVTQAGIGDGEAVLIGEVERPLGLGPELIAITADMFVDRGDHIQLTLTADQIREKLAKAKQ